MNIFEKHEVEVLSIMTIFDRLTEMILSARIDYDDAKSILKKDFKNKLNHFGMVVLQFYTDKQKGKSKKYDLVLRKLLAIAVEVSKLDPETTDFIKKIKEDINNELDKCKKYFEQRNYHIYYERIKSLLHETSWVGQELYFQYVLIFIMDLSELYYRKEKDFFNTHMSRILKDFEFDEIVTIFLNLISTLEMNNLQGAKVLKERLPPPLDVIADKMVEFKQKNL